MGRVVPFWGKWGGLLGVVLVGEGLVGKVVLLGNWGERLVVKVGLLGAEASVAAASLGF